MIGQKRDFTDFVEAGDNVAQVNPRRPRFSHLVKQVIPEKLQQVAVACLRPSRVLLKPDSQHKVRVPKKEKVKTQCGGYVTYSGRSLMVPSLASRRKRRPFCTS